MEKNKTGKYFKYAIGEIILVVIGILIALQINNWNEGRKNERNIIENLKTIQQELLLDINKSMEVITLYYKKDSLICRALNSEVSVQDYKNNSQYSTLITRNFLLKTHKNGFEKLEEKIDVLPEKYKKLFKNLNTIYLEDIPTIEMRNQWMVDYALSTKNNYVKNYEWYLSYSQDEINDDGINYFMKDAFHINNVARYRELLIDNLLGSVQDFRENAITSYNEISIFLQSGNGLLESTKNFNLKNKDLKKYAGKYVFPNLGQIVVEVLVVEGELYVKFNGQNQLIKLKPLTDSFFYFNNTQTVRFNEIENGNFEIWSYNNCKIYKGKKLNK